MGRKFVINIIYYFKLHYSMIWPDMEYTTICNINKTIWHHIQLLLCIGLLSFIQGLFSEVDIVPSITLSLIRKKNRGLTSLNYLICKISHFVTTKVKKLDTLYTIKHSKKLRVVLLRSQDGNPASKRLSRNLGWGGFSKGHKILKKEQWFAEVYTRLHFFRILFPFVKPQQPRFLLNLLDSWFLFLLLNKTTYPELLRVAYGILKLHFSQNSRHFVDCLRLAAALVIVRSIHTSFLSPLELNIFLRCKKVKKRKVSLIDPF